jgi:hypothetical protein
MLVLMSAVRRECTQGFPPPTRPGKKGAMGKFRGTMDP